jgi:tetratricopeptide (TPR) repeat protein
MSPPNYQPVESANVDRLVVLQRAASLHPTQPEGWRLLADELEASGRVHAAHEARAHFIKAAVNDPRLMAAARGLIANDVPLAEALLRQQLRAYPTDVVAIRMLAEVAARLRRYADAQVLLERCLELAPGFHEARHNYCVVLFRQMKTEAALEQVEHLLSQRWRIPACRNLKAAILATLGDYSESIDTYAAVLVDFPEQPKVWMSYGHALKTAGRYEESILAYRRTISLQPALGEAYWSLANLKTCRFSADEVAAMRAALADDRLAAEDRLHFEFALGKALEDESSYADSFAHYAAGAAIRRQLVPYSAEEMTTHVRRTRSLYTPTFFAERAGAGADATDPIFIVGLPRAGSTLLEQILASHPLIEGTMELPDIPAIARELAGQRQDGGPKPSYLQTLASLTRAQLRALGERYLAQTRVQRKTGAPFFIDKMPNNCLHVALIHLILPSARIVDARRHPMACCFSGFKQHFARGQNFSYGLADIGRYYRDYVELMAHFDAVLPGRVHRVIYERLVDDTEAEVARLLDYCGVPFDGQCLKFHENTRAVRTASSEQVRLPMFRQAIDHWRHFEPWLGTLKTALGTVLDCYPQVPACDAVTPTLIQQEIARTTA